MTHRPLHSSRGTLRAAEAPMPTITHRGNSRRLRSGLGLAQHLWINHFHIPAVQPCLRAQACLAQAQPRWWGGGGRSQGCALADPPREAQGACVLCLPTSRHIFSLCWARNRTFKTQNSRKLPKHFWGCGGGAGNRTDAPLGATLPLAQPGKTLSSKSGKVPLPQLTLQSPHLRHLRA